MTHPVTHRSPQYQPQPYPIPAGAPRTRTPYFNSAGAEHPTQLAAAQGWGRPPVQSASGLVRTELHRPPNPPVQSAPGLVRTQLHRPPNPPVPQWGPNPPQQGSNGQRGSNGLKKTAILACAVVAVAAIGAGAYVVTNLGSDDGAATNASSQQTMTKAGTQTQEPSESPDSDTPANTPTKKAPAPDTQGQPSSQDTGPGMSPAAVLLTAAEVQQAITGGAVVVKSEGESMVDNSDRLGSSDCMSPWGPLELASYTGSGYLSVAGQSLEDRTDSNVVVVQGAVSFTSADAAQAYVATAEQSWIRCANTSVLATANSGKKSTWDFGTMVTQISDTTFLTLPVTPRGSSGWACERALGAKGALVLDVIACGDQSQGNGLAVAKAMAEKTKGQPA